MENYVAGQLAALGAAVALGAAGGLVYDLLRVLRRRRPGLTHAADAVFGGMCLLGALCPRMKAIFSSCGRAIMLPSPIWIIKSDA